MTKEWENLFFGVNVYTDKVYHLGPKTYEYYKKIGLIKNEKIGNAKVVIVREIPIKLGKGAYK